MILMIKIGVLNSCTPISFFVHPTLPTKRYKNHQSKISVDTLFQDRIRPALTTDPCSDNGCVGMQTVAWKERCAEQ